MKKPKAKSPKLKAKSEQRTAKSQQQIAVMLELLRSAVLDRDPVLDHAVNVDWDDLMDRASKQGVLAWVYDGICKLPKEQQPPRQQRINWALSAQEIWDRYHKQKEVLADMVKVCNENGMKLLLLKGIGLAELYPKPESRPSGDIDVYFFDDFEKGNELFAKGNVTKSGKHDVWNAGGFEIENHKTFFDTNTPQKIAVNAFIESCLWKCNRSNVGYYTLDALSNIIFLTYHALKHFCIGEDLPIRNIVDFGLFMNSLQFQLSFELLHQELKSLDLIAGYDFLLYFSEQVLGINLSNCYISCLSTIDRTMIRYFFAAGKNLPLVNIFSRNIVGWYIYSRFLPRILPHNTIIKDGLINKMVHVQNFFCKKH